MAEKPTVELWDHSSLWNDLGADHGGSLMDMIPDAEHMLHILPDAPGQDQKGIEGDACDGSRDILHSGDGGDEAGDMEPPCKLHAAKPDSQAARTKAYREKQRRAQLNNRYTELAALIDPGKAPKTDRNLILEDAVRVIGQLRVENNQLRQLNKLLEERVQEQETKRGHALYQQSLMMQGGLSSTPRADGASTSRGAAVQGITESGGAALDGSDVPPVPSPPVSGPATAASPGPQMDQAALAISMMNMAMQLLQSKGIAPGQAAMPSGAAQAAHPHMWPMGMPQQMPQPMLPYMCPPAMGMPQQEAQMKSHGDPMHVGPPGATVNGNPATGMAPGVEKRDADGTATVPPPPPTGSKQPALQPMGYSHGYNFPPMGGMPLGWPPANMVDQNRDSKLRPPAA